MQDLGASKTLVTYLGTFVVSSRPVPSELRLSDAEQQKKTMSSK